MDRYITSYDIKTNTYPKFIKYLEDAPSNSSQLFFIRDDVNYMIYIHRNRHRYREIASTLKKNAPMYLY